MRVERATARRSHAEPALASPAPGLPYQWQFAAVRADQVPPAVSQAAAAFTIAVIDTGADLGAPDLSAKAPLTYSLRSGQADVTDTNGHGTFVAALAAGSSTNGDGIAGVGGEARLMVVQAGGAGGAFTDVDEAAAIVYAVDHGARIVNLSLGGPTTSSIEQRAVDYAVSKGALLVAAVGNDYLRGNAVEYPAALLQPVGSTWHRRARALGRRLDDLRAPGRRSPAPARMSPSRRPASAVFSAVSSSSSPSNYPRTALAGLARRRLRLRQRHLVRVAPGRRRRRTRVGGEPGAPRRRGGVDPRADRDRARRAGTPSSATACSTSPRPSRRHR